MKNTTKIFTILALIMISFTLIAQPPHPWDQTIGGGEGNNPIGGGAPVGEGIIFLLSLAFAYGAKKFNGYRKKITLK